MSTINLFRYETDLIAFNEGQVIFSEGEDGDTMYVIREGLVDLTSGQQRVASLSENEFFGEMALIDKKPRSATAVAATDCRVLPVNQKRFLYMVQETPFFAIEVMTTMCERIRRLNQQS
jgi:CRP/FNR family cyclic AMP-dependent transcriptional regulator